MPRGASPTPDPAAPAASLLMTGWPIVVLVCPPRFESAWVTGLDAEFKTLFARNEPFALITHTTQVLELPSPIVRRQLAAWMSRPDQTALQKRLNVGSATIVPNALMRGALQALYWLWTPAAPQSAARDFDDAWLWCVEQLEGAKLALPEPSLALKARVVRELTQSRAL